MINAVILAGSKDSKKWSEAELKALFRINGKAMIDYVIEALRNTDGIDKIVVAGPAPKLGNFLKDKVDGLVDSNGSIMENIAAAARRLGTDNDILICSSDIPMVSPEAINDFIEKSQSLKADLCYPIIDRRANEKKYPEAERTYVKLKEGSFTGGNIFYINPKILDKGYIFGEKLLKVRKNPLKMSRLLGFGFMVRYAAGLMTIENAEKKFFDITGIEGKAVISEFPEMGNDVDKPSDVIIATAHLSK